MNLNTLKDFRQQVYTCMEQRADALFNLCDGLLSEPQARSLPELSHSPFFERKWPSVYAHQRGSRRHSSVESAALRQAHQYRVVVLGGGAAAGQAK